ncbi:urea ABC transporter permease subunit UrtB [Bordetella genomosp. 9]|uniref:Urea ABC transporter permease subunit UrtB n=1 Tax=Bordetella genomosp. 9 TaxID=1416803 RepID=A0A261RNG2_9BORD|nr:urea ABC transporter permease subunit UrtB [Bordetella genomosp. 9]OZI26317.1 urea ABC transporter permease subunit UrtB [Bordetella genomosp. 9]
MESFSDLGAILLMQGFNGLSVFSVLLLMALGLAIIFGQMGVINMAHGEFLAVGAYTTYLFSELTQQYAPGAMPYYFFVAIAAAFVATFALGWLVEWLMIRHLYRRPLDTLLATWGLSLVMQQALRSVFGPREVSPTLPDWLMGSVQPLAGVDIPINGLVVMSITVILTVALLFALFRSSWGLHVRATVQNRVMSGAVGIDTKKVDRMTFALGCGIAGIAGAAFTTIGSTGPTSGSLYIVDTFLTVVFGGAASLYGTIASAFVIAQTQSVSEFFLTGSMAKVLTLSAVVIILMLRPQGLFTIKVRK